jgi:hypothetical protein
VNYYRLTMTACDCWILSPKLCYDDGSELDEWAFQRGVRIEGDRPIPFKLLQEGTRLDFNPTAFSPIVFSRRMAEFLDEVAPGEIQRLPARIDGERDGDWEVINVLTCLDCIDHDRSIIQYRPANDSHRPGKPRGVIKLVIKTDVARGHHVFLPQDWELALIGSQVVRDGLEAMGATGVKYVRVDE